MNKISKLFYRYSNFLVAISITAIWGLYLYFLLVGKAVEFQVPNSNIQSLGTTFGIEEAKISQILTSRSEK